jgi:hypothetical protein
MTHFMLHTVDYINAVLVHYVSKHFKQIGSNLKIFIVQQWMLEAHN